MGTSSSHPSPPTPSWEIVRRVLANEAVPTAIQSTEIWRAAASDAQAQLVDRLSHPIVSKACALAGVAGSPTAALASLEAVLVANHTSGLVFDMARRALARSVAARAGERGFAAELFSELVSYYTSRDIPSYVGARERAPTTSAAIELKDQLREIARRTSRSVSPLTSDPQGWASFVRAVVARLQTGGAL